MDERVIDGVLHRLEGKAYVALTAEELTARLLEARESLHILRTLPPPAKPSDTWPWPPWQPPYTVGDVIPSPFEITCASGTASPSGPVSGTVVHWPDGAQSSLTQ